MITLLKIMMELVILLCKVVQTKSHGLKLQLILIASIYKM